MTSTIVLVTVRRRYPEADSPLKPAGPDFETVTGSRSIDLARATLLLPDGWSTRLAGSGLLQVSNAG